MSKKRGMVVKNQHFRSCAADRGLGAAPGAFWSRFGPPTWSPKTAENGFRKRSKCKLNLKPVLEALQAAPRSFKGERSGITRGMGGPGEG